MPTFIVCTIYISTLLPTYKKWIFKNGSLLRVFGWFSFLSSHFELAHFISISLIRLMLSFCSLLCLTFGKHLAFWSHFLWVVLQVQTYPQLKVWHWLSISLWTEFYSISNRPILSVPVLLARKIACNLGPPIFLRNPSKLATWAMML